MVILMRFSSLLLLFNEIVVYIYMYNRAAAIVFGIRSISRQVLLFRLSKTEAACDRILYRRLEAKCIFMIRDSRYKINRD